MDTKTCLYCGETLPLSAFGKLSSSEDGLNYYCRVCRSKIRKKSEEKHPGAERYRRFIAKNPDYEKKRLKKKQETEPEKLKARNAIKNKPRGACVICGTTENIEGHHYDYSKPDEVIWVCRMHHKQIEAGWTPEELRKTS